MIGHYAVCDLLEKNLPQVTLLVGPKSVGKRTLAQYVLTRHGCTPADTRVVEKLLVDDARSLFEFMSVAPFGKLKGAVVRLEQASDISLNVLLKLLEEPPSFARFVLTSLRIPSATIQSRAELYRLGLLTPGEISRILVSRGMNKEAAQTAAARSLGTVDSALDPGPSDEAKAAVLSALRAVADNDLEKLDAAVSNWSDDAHQLLKLWVQEVITGQWRWFKETETFGLSTPESLHWAHGLLTDLSRTARPKIVARHALAMAINRKE